MDNYIPLLSDEEVEYLEKYGTEEEINQAVEMVLDHMDGYFEYIARCEEEKKKRQNKM